VNASDEKVKNVSVVYGLYKDPNTNLVSSYKDSHGLPATWPLHNISRDVNCAKCHGTKSNATNTLLAGPTLAHTTTGTCDKCHSGYPTAPFTLPATNLCKDCHTIYATQYGAPNITGTSMETQATCAGCHGGGSSETALVTLADHDIDRSASASTQNCNEK